MDEIQLQYERLRQRALLYMAYNDVSGAKFRDLVNDFAKQMPDHTSFNKFFNRQNYSSAIFNGIASFLEHKGYWPYIDEHNVIYPLIVEFFGGGPPLPADVVDMYSGKYIYYQHSTRFPGRVATSKFEIRKPDKNNAQTDYLIVEEYSRDDDFKEWFKGMFFRNGDIDIIIMRLEENSQARNIHGPKLLFLVESGESSAGPKAGTRWIAGRLLKTSAQERRRHQSNWFARKVKTHNEKDLVLSEEQIAEDDPTAHKMLYDMEFVRER